MKKTDIVQAVYQAHGGMTWKEVEETVDGILGEMRNGIVAEGFLKLRGFGSLEVVARKAKMGKHPKTGKPVLVNSRKTVVFRAAKNTVF